MPELEKVGPTFLGCNPFPSTLSVASKQHFLTVSMYKYSDLRQKWTIISGFQLSIGANVTFGFSDCH